MGAWHWQAGSEAPRRGKAGNSHRSRSHGVGSPSADWGRPRAARPRPSRSVPAPLRAPPPPSPQPPPPAPAPQHKLSVPLAPSSAPGASRSGPAHSAHSGQPPPQDPPSPAPLSAFSGPAERPGRSAPPSSDQVSREDAGKRPYWERWFGWLVLDWGGTRGGLDPRAIVQLEPEPRIWVPGSLEGRGGKALREAPPTPPTPTPLPPRPGRVGWGRSGNREIVSGAFVCPTVRVWGAEAGVLGAHGSGALPLGSSYPGLPVPGPAALWTPGSRALRARPAPAPRRPRARPPGVQAGS